MAKKYMARQERKAAIRYTYKGKRIILYPQGYYKVFGIGSTAKFRTLTAAQRAVNRWEKLQYKRDKPRSLK